MWFLPNDPSSTVGATGGNSRPRGLHDAVMRPMRRAGSSAETGDPRPVGATGPAATLLAVVAGNELDLSLDTPDGWRAQVEEITGEYPTTLGDAGGDWPWWRSWETGYDPESPVDQAVMAAREATFPHHGLDPWFD